jgi:hypothetical protein
MRAGERGQALVETLVASAIIAALLGVTYEAVLTTTHAEQVLRDKRIALPLAQSLLARVGGDIALAPGMMEGNSNGLDWRLQIDRYEDAPGRAIDGPPLLEVQVSVSAPGKAAPAVELRTLRVGA